ncbi:50S ribosomal protein L3 N(5)-glutamine methyltransferase [Blochmannia endosymbiont of Polyrhachis (Hedomyrma) turneri]|uniref:50S ribosomal protein L3 N(5)-glutamine methyltransferase n=1 Tax=Blochmannia endosymbiont of Polyrhachis (Hedomyrma) turneri TaxID=1505596 RepID=UPI00061A69F2|nr:50S ribosomal protein L3 N(5)-glutamine methyltransferase [Blochmannia endosymbiont of Polyrhachis (Hedomyrma) turneri]AKC60062.1 50S ribosomal protein L3 glutamine methyltransferase [Blochmannia endosymbiont of Polyrhachis (Hedomyrma) turneri]
MKKNIIKELRTILDLLRWTGSQFNASPICYGHGTNNYWDESRHLVLPSLHLPIESPQIIYHANLTSYEKNHIIKQVIKRINMRIPVPYLTNLAWFCGLEFYIDKRVFIPRSPLAELIKTHFKNLLPQTPKHILDMCTGSGCIAIATAIHFPNSEIDAIDISSDALKIAEHNIKLHNLENRIVPIKSDLFHDVPKLKYNLILANPPYVNEFDIYKLPKEFLFEPKIALCAGNDELQIIKKILYNADQYLSHDGILICEVGNTDTQLKKTYPNIPFHWITCQHGGHGIFMLTYKQLITNKNIIHTHV